MIAALYDMCKKRGNMVFDNTEVNAISREFGFGNQFDVTKLDKSADLPVELVADDAFVVHLGNQRPAKHQFVYGITNGYHRFEPIPEERRYQWLYRRSMLNNVNASESNILFVGYNQRIVHDFLYEDITASPKVYGSNRTRIPLDYRVGRDAIDASSVQIEIDLTLEHFGEITVFEAKNGEPADFNIFQLFNPYRYYLRQRYLGGIQLTAIQCCYLLRQRNRLRLYLYSFPDPRKPSSIQFERNAEYTLVER